MSLPLKAPLEDEKFDIGLYDRTTLN